MKNVYDKELDIKANLFTTIFLVFMILVCYIFASFTSPYQTDISRDLLNRINLGEIIEIRESDFPTNCDICQMRKFERSSHCSICSKCVLRRDHHCVWIGTCVGLQNLRYFINFLVWVIVCLIL